MQFVAIVERLAAAAAAGSSVLPDMFDKLFESASIWASRWAARQAAGKGSGRAVLAFTWQGRGTPFETLLIFIQLLTCERNVSRIMDSFYSTARGRAEGKGRQPVRGEGNKIESLARHEAWSIGRQIHLGVKFYLKLKNFSWRCWHCSRLGLLLREVNIVYRQMKNLINNLFIWNLKNLEPFLNTIIWNSVSVFSFMFGNFGKQSTFVQKIKPTCEFTPNFRDK